MLSDHSVHLKMTMIAPRTAFGIMFFVFIPLTFATVIEAIREGDLILWLDALLLLGICCLLIVNMNKVDPPT